MDPNHFGQVGASYALELALAGHFGPDTEVVLVKSRVSEDSIRMLKDVDLVGLCTTVSIL